MDGLDGHQLRELIREAAKVKSKEIGHVRLKGAYSFIEIPSELTERVLQSFKGVSYHGRRVRVEIQNEPVEFPKKKKYRY